MGFFCWVEVIFGFYDYVQVVGLVVDGYMLDIVVCYVVEDFWLDSFVVVFVFCDECWVVFQVEGIVVCFYQLYLEGMVQVDVVVIDKEMLFGDVGGVVGEQEEGYVCYFFIGCYVLFEWDFIFDIVLFGSWVIESVQLGLVEWGYYFGRYQGIDVNVVGEEFYCLFFGESQLGVFCGSVSRSIVLFGYGGFRIDIDNIVFMLFKFGEQVVC